MPAADHESTRWTNLARQFHARFGVAPTLGASAPGRVNLIGEHTDYNDGFVLPMAIVQRTRALARVMDGGPGRVEVFSLAQEDSSDFVVDAGLAPGEPHWVNYVKGVFAGWHDRGLAVPSLQIALETEVPIGGGLSSSASLEVTIATLLEAATGQRLPGAEKALLCQKAEHTFAHVPCGIMDQFICAMARPGHAMLLDCRSLEPTQVPMEDPSVAFLVINSNVKHALTGSEYPERRAACEKAAALLGVAALRDADMPRLDAAKERLGPTNYRRARHVIGEIGRTLRAADAARAGDWAGFGKLMTQSHVSLRDDFEVSTPEIDTLVALALELAPTGAVLGSRITGGGFGGCTVTLIKADRAQEVIDHVARGYRARTGITPTLFVTSPSEGARVDPAPGL